MKMTRWLSLAIVAFLLVVGTEAFGGDQGPDDAQLITCRANHISLLEALKIVCQLSGLKMRVEGNVVMLVPVDAPDGEIVHRTYHVVPSFKEKTDAVQAELRLMRPR